jgi:phosphoglycolate phosphatase
MNSNRHGIIWDFDGPIAKTLDISIEVANRLIANHPEKEWRRIKPEDRERYRNLGHNEIRRGIGVLLRDVPMVQREGQELLAELTPKAQPAPGVPEILRELYESGRYTQVVLTSNAKENVDRFLKNNELADIFAEIYADCPIYGKRHGLVKAYAEMGFNPEDLFYVCDEVRDIHAAKGVGFPNWFPGWLLPRFPVISVGWGYNSSPVLRAQKPTEHIEDPDELPNLLEKLISEKSKK